MRVCLRRGYHHAFDDLIEHPPKGVKYSIPGIVSSHGQSGILNVMKRKAWRTYSNLMRRPNAIKIRVPPGTDLIHSNSGFLIENRMPWVMDLEHAASFVGFEVGKLESVRRTVERHLASEYCKKIMPWTFAGEKSVRSSLDTRKFEDKMEVVYPAMEPIQVKRRRHDDVNLLFVSYGFFNKGGKEVLKACAELSRRLDFRLTMVSEVPDEYRRKYPQFDYVRPNLPRSQVLGKYFSSADVFVLPSYMDTFGMVYLEAMSAGIPIVASNVFALPEIVGKSGLLVDIGKYSWYGKDNLFAWKSWDQLEGLLRRDAKPKIVDQLKRNIARLIEDKGMRDRLGRNGRRDVASGRFSIKARNAKLRRIYEEAVRA